MTHAHPLRRNASLYAVMVLAALIAALGFAGRAEGQGVSIRISPPNFQFEVDPGENLAQTLTVTNPGQIALPVTMSVSKFAPAGPGGQAQLVADDGDPASVTRWLTLSPMSFILEPGQSQKVTVIITVPQDAPPGGQYASVLASIGTGATTGSSLGVGQQIGALLLLRVKGEVLETALVSGISAPTLKNKGPVDLSVTVENTGNVHIKPVGQLVIKSTFGKEVAKLSIPPENILPRSDRTFTVKWDTGWGLGRYTATYTGVFGQTSQNITASQSFFIFPWTIFLPVLLVVLLFALLLVRIRKRIARAVRVLASGE